MSRILCLFDRNHARRLVDFCSTAAGISSAEFLSFDSATLLETPAGDIVDNQQLKRLDEVLLSPGEDYSGTGVIIDATGLSEAIQRELTESPETVCAFGLALHEDFRATKQLPRELFALLKSSRPRALLSLAIMLSHRGHSCLVCINDPQTDNAFELAMGRLLEKAANTSMLGFRIVVDKEMNSALTTAVRAMNSLQCIGGRSFATPTSGRSGSLVLERLLHYSEQWETEEFEDNTVIESYRAILRQTFRADGLSKEREVMLRAVTLARLLATRSFEHHGCNATILLMDRNDLASLAASEADDARNLATAAKASLGAKIFNFETRSRPTWLHLADQWLVEDGIETALSDRSVLLVDIHTGRVLGVYELRTHTGTRFETLNRLTEGSHSTFAIAALESGFVEVHHAGSLKLWYDRFRWRYDPFGRLQRWIRRSRVLPAESEADNLEKICAAISILMDNRESSILIFTHDEQLQQLYTLLEPMRPQIGLDEGSAVGDYNHPARLLGAAKSIPRSVLLSGPLQNFSASTLASIFRLDGAHVISGGRITHFAQRIVLPKKPSNEPGNTSVGGTGRAAAQCVADHVPGSVVVKVSSSGELRVYA